MTYSNQYKDVESIIDTLLILDTSKSSLSWLALRGFFCSLK